MFLNYYGIRERVVCVYVCVQYGLHNHAWLFLPIMQNNEIQSSMKSLQDDCHCNGICHPIIAIILDDDGADIPGPGISHKPLKKLIVQTCRVTDPKLTLDYSSHQRAVNLTADRDQNNLLTQTTDLLSKSG